MVQNIVLWFVLSAFHCVTWILYQSCKVGYSYPLKPCNVRYEVILTLKMRTLKQDQDGKVGRSWTHLLLFYCCLLTHSCIWLCSPVHCSPPGSSVHGIFQARIVEWVAISFSRGSSQPRDWTCISYTGRQILYRWATGETSLPMDTKTIATYGTTPSENDLEICWIALPQLRI